MEIVIYTSDPEVINITEIKQAIQRLGYYVLSVVVEDRGL